MQLVRARYGPRPSLGHGRHLGIHARISAVNIRLLITQLRIRGSLNTVGVFPCRRFAGRGIVNHSTVVVEALDDSSLFLVTFSSPHEEHDNFDDRLPEELAANGG